MDSTQSHGAQNRKSSLMEMPASPQQRNVVAACGVTRTAKFLPTSIAFDMFSGVMPYCSPTPIASGSSPKKYGLVPSIMPMGTAKIPIMMWK